jgi:hypothetical protein
MGKFKAPNKKKRERPGRFPGWARWLLIGAAIFGFSAMTIIILWAPTFPG